MEDFDICIVGAGTWGSATAYHVTSCARGLRVCLIGPGEPQDRMEASVFGCHYDEGRITRPFDSDPIWAELAKRSIRRYRDLEKKSGIHFYEEVGVLCLGEPQSDYIQRNKATPSECQVNELWPNDVNEKFPFLNVRGDLIGLYSEKDAGYINIRKQMAAHQVMGKKQGCVIIPEIVQSIHGDHSSGGREEMLVISTDSGAKLRSKRVLLTTGCFTGFRDLVLPEDVGLPDMKITTETVLLLEMSEAEVAKMKTMPSIVYKPHDPSHACYILPPIKYPDGKYYLKIGHSTWGNKPLDSQEAVIHHYRSQGSRAVGDALYNILKSIMADFSVLSIKRDSCVTGKTSTGYPYCDMVTDKIGILVGGNGYGAKSADEIGRMGANMILNGHNWKHDMPQDKFKFVKCRL